MSYSTHTDKAKGEKMKDINTLAREAFDAVVAAQEAFNALRSAVVGVADVRTLGVTPEEFHDLADELDFDTTSLVRVRTHVAKISRKTNKEA